MVEERPEKYDLRVVNTAETLWNSSHDTVLVSQEFELTNGLTIGKLAQRVHRDILAFKMSKKVVGSVVVDGENVPMPSQSIGEPTIVFIINGNCKRKAFLPKTIQGTK